MEGDTSLLVLMIVLEFLKFVMYYVLIDQVRILSCKIKEVVGFLKKDMGFYFNLIIFGFLFIMGACSNALLVFFSLRGLQQ